jgi:hypothetical protein
VTCTHAIVNAPKPHAGENIMLQTSDDLQPQEWDEQMNIKKVLLVQFMIGQLQSSVGYKTMIINVLAFRSDKKVVRSTLA